jgi:hypothetical protein
MRKCSKTINRFYRAKAIVDKILSDPNTVKKIQQFILTESGRGSEEYINTYSEVDDIIRQITPERVVIIKSDGQFYYDSNVDVYTASGIYNHNSRIEVIESLTYLYEGGDIINKTALIKKYPKKLSCMILAGYGIASRSSSTNKKIQSYVAKTYSDKGNPLNINIFTLRVSISHDVDNVVVGGNVVAEPTSDPGVNVAEPTSDPGVNVTEPSVNVAEPDVNVTVTEDPAKPKKLLRKAPRWFFTGPKTVVDALDSIKYILDSSRSSG